MVTSLDKVDVVFVVLGWAGGIISAELANTVKKVVAIERGDMKKTSDYTGVKDELRFTNRFEMMQDLAYETITSRSTLDDVALPVRTRDEMMAGTDLGGGSVHWAGSSYRYWPYEFGMYRKTIEKYGKDNKPEGMREQDWVITYDELDKYYGRCE